MRKVAGAAVIAGSMATRTGKLKKDSPDKISPTPSLDQSQGRIDAIWDDVLENFRIRDIDSIIVPATDEDIVGPVNLKKVVYNVRKRRPVGENDRLQVGNAVDSTKLAVLNQPTVVTTSKRDTVIVAKVAPEHALIQEFPMIRRDSQVIKKDRHHASFSRKTGTVISKQRVQLDPIGQVTVVEHQSHGYHDEFMEQRRAIQEGIAYQIGRHNNRNDMLMRQDGHDHGVFEKGLIDRLMPYASMRGYGNVKGAEFWRQHQWIGGEERGIFDTPGQAHRGYPGPVERIVLADIIREELGVEKPGRLATKLINERAHSLKRSRTLGRDFELFSPEAANLVVLPSHWAQRVEEGRGKDGGLIQSPSVQNMEQTTSISSFPVGNHLVFNPSDLAGRDTTLLSGQQRVMGPALTVENVTVRPRVSSQSQQEQVQSENSSGYLNSLPEVHCVLECSAGGRACKRFLEFTNAGSTVIFFSWKRIHVENAFQEFSVQAALDKDLVIDEEGESERPNGEPKKPLAIPPKRLYFNACDNALLPGAQMRLPIVFKSKLAGVFQERWLLIPSPPTLSPIVVFIRGAAIQPDIYAPIRKEISSDLASKEAMSISGAILNGILDGVRTPPRPSSPIGSRKIRSLAFKQQNLKEINFDWQAADTMENAWLMANGRPGKQDSTIQQQGTMVSQQQPSTSGGHAPQSGGTTHGRRSGGAATSETRSAGGGSSTTPAPIMPAPPGWTADEWDLSVDTLYDTILIRQQDIVEGRAGFEDVEIDFVADQAVIAAENLLGQVNGVVSNLGFSSEFPLLDITGMSGHILMATMADSISSKAVILRRSLGLPEPQPPQFIRQLTNSSLPLGGSGSKRSSPTKAPDLILNNHRPSLSLSEEPVGDALTDFVDALPERRLQSRAMVRRATLANIEPPPPTHHTGRHHRDSRHFALVAPPVAVPTTNAANARPGSGANSIVPPGQQPVIGLGARQLTQTKQGTVASSIITPVGPLSTADSMLRIGATSPTPETTIDPVRLSKYVDRIKLDARECVRDVIGTLVDGVIVRTEAGGEPTAADLPSPPLTRLQNR